MANLRTFYACQAVAIAKQAPDASGAYATVADSGYKFIHGVQSVGINSSFDFILFLFRIIITTFFGNNKNTRFTHTFRVIKIS